MQPSTSLQVALLTATLALASAPAHAATATVTYSTGEHQIVIPAGVSALGVTAVGGRGGQGRIITQGGRAAIVTANLAVSGGQVYYLLVGGNGTNGNDSCCADGAGGGGGASDVRTQPASAGLDPDPRILVAAGGGGGGGGGVYQGQATGGAGGDARAAGGTAMMNGPTGGQAGVPDGTGAGGSGQTQNGLPGGLGYGGTGGQGPFISGGFNGGGSGGRGYTTWDNHLPPTTYLSGGGGGGGYYGGGGGGASQVGEEMGGGGGGGGSNLVPAGGTQNLDASGTPRITITFTDNAPPAVSLDAVTALSTDATPTFSGGSSTALGDLGVAVKVYRGPSTAGQLEATIDATRNAASGAYTAQSPQLADGQYTAVAVQSDSAGHTATSPARTFTVDTTGPAIALADLADWLGDSTPAISGTGSAAAGDTAAVTVRIHDALLAGEPVTQQLPTQRDASTGAFTVVPAASLADGSYYAIAEQSDSLGNTGTSNKVHFSVDTQAPAPTLSTPADGARTNDATPALAGAGSTATGDAVQVVLRLYAGGTVAGEPTAALTADRTADTGAFATEPTTALGDGTYTAQVEQTDHAGNVGRSAPMTFIVDTTPPALTLAAPVPGASPTFTGVAGLTPGDQALVSVKVFAGGEAAGAPLQTLTATPDPTTGAYSVAVSAPLAPGTYTAQASQADDLGQVATAVRVFVVAATTPASPLADRLAPQLSRARLSRRRLRTRSAKSAIRFTLSEAATVTITFARSKSKRSAARLNRRSVKGANAVRFSRRIGRRTLRPGRYTLTIVAVDAAGNRSARKRLTVRIG